MTALVCGTGGWSGPKPGDPSEGSVLTANPAFGGIDVSWSYPDINPHAVAHSILYRGLVPIFDNSIRHSIVSGSYFFDRFDDVENPVEYFYWIQIVSINGTYGDVIGPASAIPRGTIAQVIEGLTEKIDRGVLAQSLKTDIDKIELNGRSIFEEMEARIAADDALGASIQQANNNTNAALSFINDEVNQRTTAVSAIVEQLNSMGVKVNDNTSAIMHERTVRAGIMSTMAQDIQTVQSTTEDNIASVQTSLQTNIDLLGNTVKDIGALWTAKVSVDGLIGGFGIYNDGNEVQAGFDVDTFWVGRTQANKRKPFIIQDGEVFIDNAVINQLTADKIDSRNLTIKDADGNVLLGAGSELKWDHIYPRVPVDRFVVNPPLAPNADNPDYVEGDPDYDFQLFDVKGQELFLSNSLQGVSSNSSWKITPDGSITTQRGPNRIVMSPERAEIVFNHPGTNSTSFSVDDSGNAFFGGRLLGATGTFSGSLAAGVLDFSGFGAVEMEYKTPGTRQITVPNKGWTSVSCTVVLVGAGGGGGGGHGNNAWSECAGGGGGGGGATREFTIHGLTPGSRHTLVVGAGGTGGRGEAGGADYNGKHGTNGGNTTFYGQSSNGGQGGRKGTKNSPGAGGNGGSGQFPGEKGQAGRYEWERINDFQTKWNKDGGRGGKTRLNTGGAGGDSTYGNSQAARNGKPGSMGSGAGGGAGRYKRAWGYGGKGGDGYAMLTFFDPNTVVLNSRYTALVNWLDNAVGTVPQSAR